jgi:hypothetical protein
LPNPKGKKNNVIAIVRHGKRKVMIPNWTTLTTIIEIKTGTARIRP